MRRLAWCCTWILVLLVSNTTGAAPSMPNFGGIESRAVQAVGFGATKQAATLRALDSALQQANGARISSESTAASAQLSVSTNSVGHLDISSEAFEEQVKSSSSGAIESFEILDEQRVSRTVAEQQIRATYDAQRGDSAESADLTLSGRLTEYVWRVEVRARVLAFSAPEDARPSVIVAEPRIRQSQYTVADAVVSSERLRTQLQSRMQSALDGTGRFVVADRTLSAEIDKELDFIRSGAARLADTARLGNQVSADLILVLTIEDLHYRRTERSLRMSDRTVVSYSGRAEASIALVNATTGLTVVTDTITVVPPGREPTTLATTVDGASVLAGMVEQIIDFTTNTVLRATFPISVVAIDGSRVVLSQGGQAVDEGAWYELATLEKSMTDPQTGLSLGQMESVCCQVRIDRVEPNAAYGSLARPLPADFIFTPGSMELRREVTPPGQHDTNADPAPHAQAMEDDWSPFEEMASPSDDDW